MKDLDYETIEACIARARTMRSQALGDYLAAGWRLLAALPAHAGRLLAKARPHHGITTGTHCPG